MPLYGATQIYLLEITNVPLIEAQATCRVWELRGFEVVSVCAWQPEGQVNWIVTMRASSTLYVNWLMHGKKYQAGPYDGQAEAEAAERGIIMGYGLDKVKDSYVTAQRDHDREWIGAAE